MYGFHRLYHWVLLAAWFGGVAVQVKADVIYSADDVDVIFVGDDCPQNSKQVYLSGTVQISTDGGISWRFWGTISQVASSYGTSGIMDIANPNISVQASYSISPVGNDGAASSHIFEQGNSSGWPQVQNSVNHYASVVPNPCSEGLDFSSYNLGFTNNFASPLQLDNGDVLQPGQSTNVNFTFQQGANTNFGGSTINPNSGGYLPDGGGFTITDTLSGPIVTTNDLNPPVGGSATAYADGQGGPIVWDNTNASQQQVDQAGFNALDETMLQNENAINAGLSNLYSQLHSNGLPVTGNLNLSDTNIFNGASNVWVENWPSNYTGGSTNSGGGVASNVWVMNFPTNIDTNTLISMVMSHTNLAYGVMNPVQADASSLLGALPSSLGDVAGSPQEQDVQIGPPTAPITIPLAVLPSGVSTPFNAIRGLIAWFIVVGLIIWNYKTLFDCFYRVMTVPQAQGADAGIFSQIGANAATAIISATLIVSVASALPVIATGFLAGELAFLGGTSSPLNFFAVMGWAYQFLSQYIPIYTMFSAFGMRAVYYFGLRFFEMIGLAVVKLIVGI